MGYPVLTVSHSSRPDTGSTRLGVVCDPDGLLDALASVVDDFVRKLHRVEVIHHQRRVGEIAEQDSAVARHGIQGAQGDLRTPLSAAIGRRGYATLRRSGL